MLEKIRFRHLDFVNTNVLVCNKKLEIIFANQKSIDILNEFSDLLPKEVSGNTIVGTNIDVFHKKPSHQRNLLSKLENLPHQTTINIGKEFLDLHIEALYNLFGQHCGFILCWNVSTQTHKLNQMIDKMPINIITADPETFHITYVNKTSIETLRDIENALPVKADQLLGQSIDIFHKNPGQVRDILRDPKNLPYHATIKVGSHYLKLDVTAIMTNKGIYLNPMLSWRIVTENYDVVDRFDAITTMVNQTYDKLDNNVKVLVENMEDTKNKTISVANATIDTNEKIQSAAAAAEELSTSIKEIASQVFQNAHKSEKAARQANHSIKTINTLSEASENIGGVIALINEITDQINLLALNATIESARAGKAGKGFAVVSSEIKALASQTANATAEINEQIINIQSQIAATVEDMQLISKHVLGLRESNTIIAAAVEEQTAVASEISQNIQGTAINSNNIAREIREVSETADSTRYESQKINTVSQELSEACLKLRELITYAANQMGIKK